MGVMKGTITYVKFYVKGDLPSEQVHMKTMERIRTRGFRKLQAEDDSASVGWVPIERPFDDEITFREEGVFFGSYVNLGMRVDRWKFSTALMKSKTLAAEKAYKAKTGKERLSRGERAEIREMVEIKLRREGVPVTSVSDMSWNMSTGEVRFFGKGKATIEFFFELFERSFGLRLVPASPYSIAHASVTTKIGEASLDKNIGDKFEALLRKLEPTPFHHKWPVVEGAV